MHAKNSTQNKSKERKSRDKTPKMGLTDAQCLCAGQKLASEPQDPAAAPLPTPSVPETRGRNKGSDAFGGGGPALPERGVREGSGQRMPRRLSATRLPKRGGPGKSPTRSST
ncbi:hypothetical protein E2I00_003688 [Balaenoptera physalus]|uniref:Uncharacterized protein n=1 Tax=Balaenoptera physalus TaxID=9770 RepID=A0A643BZS1_BALPH|nr:hypothetical protein E2I00_003688 [Balaenoptera physalus]